MNLWAFWHTVIYLWLLFQEQPLVVYLEGPGLYGAGIPLLVSLLILYRFPLFSLFHFYALRELIQNVFQHPGRIFHRLPAVQDAPQDDPFKQIILGLFLGALVVGVYTGYWGPLGYHFLDAGLLVWPLLAFLSPAFHPAWAYPLTYFAMLFDDVWGAGQWGHWAGDFWFGVGGEGFHDGLFVGPATALVLSLALALLASKFRRWRLFQEAAQSTPKETLITLEEQGNSNDCNPDRAGKAR